MGVVRLYTKEQEQWLIDNCQHYEKVKDIVRDFNELFGTNFTYQQIRNFKKNKNLQGCLYFNEEQIQFIKDNINKYYYNDFVSIFNEKFNTNKKKQSFVMLVSKGIVSKTEMLNDLRSRRENDNRMFKQNQLDWLNDNRVKYNNLTELTKAFNDKFNLNKTYRSIQRCFTNNKLDGKRKTPIKYTNEQKQWCLDNYKNYNDYENRFFDVHKMRKDFNEKFNLNLSKNNFNHLIYEKIKINLEFDYGEQSGYFARSKQEIGYERIIAKEWYVKISNKSCREVKKGRARDYLNYRRKSNIMYEKYHNVKVDDEKQTVLFLNGDHNDFSKDNLYLCEKNEKLKYTARFISHNTLPKNQKLRKIAIMSIQLENVMKGVIK